MYHKETLEAISLLKEMIKIPSFSREEQTLSEYLHRYFESRALKPKKIGNNIYLINKEIDKHKKTILLNSHIDTVKPVTGWKLDPFVPLEKEGKIFGLGSNDAGASVVSLLQTFLILSKKEQPYNLIFLASAEEEVSGKNGVEQAIDLLPKIDFAIVGEPTQMNLAIAEKGLIVLDCTIYGKAGHAARNEGENAIYKSLKAIEWFQNYKFEKKSTLLEDVKMSVTQINAGTQHNVIPDKCTFVVDIRTNEQYTNEELLRIINEKTNCEVSARSTRLSSSKTPKNHPIIKRSAALHLQLYGSPTLSDQALMKFPSVKIGPGKSERSHTADEYVRINEIEEAIKIYVNLLDGLEI
ncbi:MAG: M20 family metallo-hydrolase [Paludibacteraceae bacterium]